MSQQLQRLRYTPQKILLKQECVFHKRPNCYVISAKNKTNSKIIRHITELENTDINFMGIPDCLNWGDFEWSLYNQKNVSIVSKSLDETKWLSVEGFGVTSKDILTDIGNFLIKLFYEQVNNIVIDEHRPKEQNIVVFKNNYIDLLYTLDNRIYFLPQSMAIIYPEKQINNILITGFKPSVPVIESQLFYQKFIIYNTLLTAMLIDENPINKYDKPSLVFKHLRLCKRDKILKQKYKLDKLYWKNDKEHIGVCNLKFNLKEFNNNHLFCLSKSIVKRAMTYAKLYENPNKLSTYAQAITTIKTKTNQRISIKDKELAEWDNQFNIIFQYFNLNYI